MTYKEIFNKMRENGEFINGIDFNNEKHYEIFLWNRNWKIK